MLKKERSRSPRKRMAGHLPRDAGTGRRHGCPGGNGTGPWRQAEGAGAAVLGTGRPACPQGGFFSFWYPVASMGRPACRGEVGQALRAAGARKGRGRDCRGQRERRNAIKNTLLPVAGISPGKSVFFIVFYEIFLRISAQRPHPCRKRVRFGEGQGRKRVCFSVFLTKFFSRD